MQTPRIALILLAAGQSRRFGANKLAALLDGEPMLRRTAKIYAGLPFAERIVVTGPDSPDLTDLGYRPVERGPPGALQSDSIARGVAALPQSGIDAVMIALGDMPLVSAAHLRTLIAAFQGQAIASGDGGRPSPPAIFPQSRFADLLQLTGDRGARELLAAAPRIEAPAAELLDIDVPADLVRLALPRWQR